MFTCKFCNRCGWIWGVIGLTALLTSGVLSQSQDHPSHDHPTKQPQQQPSQEQMARWMKYAQPSKHHDKLDPFVGEWNQKIRMWMRPDAEPQVLTGKAEYEWIMGGRFLQGTYEGNFMGQPFHAMDLLGYDNYREQYVSIWVDNLSTGLMSVKGWYNDETDTIVMHGTVDDLIHNFPNRPVRTETEIRSDDHIVYRSYTVDRNGDEYKTMELHSRRITEQSDTAASE